MRAPNCPNLSRRAEGKVSLASPSAWGISNPASKLTTCLDSWCFPWDAQKDGPCNATATAGTLTWGLEWVLCVWSWKQAGSWQRFVPLHLMNRFVSALQQDQCSLSLGVLGPLAWRRRWASAHSPGSSETRHLPLFGRAPLLLAVVVIFIKKVTQSLPAFMHLAEKKWAFIFSWESETQNQGRGLGCMFHLDHSARLQPLVRLLYVSVILLLLLLLVLLLYAWWNVLLSQMHEVQEVEFQKIRSGFCYRDELLTN